MRLTGRQLVHCLMAGLVSAASSRKTGETELKGGVASQSGKGGVPGSVQSSVGQLEKRS